MNQRVLCHFALVVKEKPYEFAFIPSAVTFDDISEALDAFKLEIEKLREQAVEQEAKLKAEAAAKEAEAV